MSNANFPSCNQPSPLTVADGATPTFVFTTNGSQISFATVNGYPVTLTDNYNGTKTLILPPVHHNINLTINYIIT